MGMRMSGKAEDVVGRSHDRPGALLPMTIGISALLVLGACTPSPQSTPVGTTGTTSATNSPATTSTMSSTTNDPPASSVPTTDSGIPPAARPNTIAGAEAFVRYYVQRINEASRTSNPTLLDPLTGPNCPGCKPLTDFISANARAGNHVDGDMWEVERTITQTFDGTSAGIIVTLNQKQVNIVDHDGREVDVVVANRVNRLMTLGYTSVWRLDRVQVLP